VNKVMIIGNVGQAPELRYTPSGKAVCSFSVATSHRYTDSTGERKEETTWFNISAWERLAETVNQYVTKGMQIYVEGRLALRTYTTKDGKPGASLDIHASNIEFLGRPKGQGQTEAEGDPPF